MLLFSSNSSALSTAHTGLAHFLIHAAEQSPKPQRAERAADALGALAPGAPHLVHMPSHTYVHVGRYADAMRVNQAALSAQQDLNARLETLGFAQTKNWNGHNRHFLWFATLMQGRGDLALETAQRLAASAASSKTQWGEYQRGLPLLTLVRLARWGDVLEETGSAGARSAHRGCSSTRAVSHLPGPKLARLPDDTLLYPGHLYSADTSSTIGEQKRRNPYLRVARLEDFLSFLGY